MQLPQPLKKTKRWTTKTSTPTKASNSSSAWSATRAATFRRAAATSSSYGDTCSPQPPSGFSSCWPSPKVAPGNGCGCPRWPPDGPLRGGTTAAVYRRSKATPTACWNRYGDA
jgi:hypothetical protein